MSDVPSSQKTIKENPAGAEPSVHDLRSGLVESGSHLYESSEPQETAASSQELTEVAPETSLETGGSLASETALPSKATAAVPSEFATPGAAWSSANPEKEIEGGAGGVYSSSAPLGTVEKIVGSQSEAAGESEAST